MCGSHQNYLDYVNQSVCICIDKHSYFIFVQSAERKDLTDGMLLGCALRFRNEFDVKLLGLSLMLGDYNVGAILFNNKHDIRNAAHEVLKEWRKDIDDSAEAYDTLKNALKERGFHELVYEVLDSDCDAKISEGGTCYKTFFLSS